MKSIYWILIPAIIVALVLISTFIKCADSPEKKKLIYMLTSNVWSGTRVEMPGLSSSAREIFGSELILIFQKNGKCVIKKSGENFTAKWKLNGNELQIRGKGINSKGDFNPGDPSMESDSPILKVYNIENYMVIFFREKDIGDP